MIVLFDGECNVCNRSIQFILKRDSNAKIQFASLQSDIGKGLLDEHGIQSNLDSIVLIQDESVYLKSSAALTICKYLNGGWPFLYVFIVIPKAIRDYLYDVVAKHRYQWFGKADHCMLVSKENRNRFLD